MSFRHSYHLENEHSVENVRGGYAGVLKHLVSISLS
jgi:hypothetical protein